MLLAWLAMVLMFMLSELSISLLSLPSAINLNISTSLFCQFIFTFFVKLFIISKIFAVMAGVMYAHPVIFKNEYPFIGAICSFFHRKERQERRGLADFLA
jgi:hypothetical protein